MAWFASTLSQGAGSNRIPRFRKNVMENAVTQPFSDKANGRMASLARLSAPLALALGAMLCVVAFAASAQEVDDVTNVLIETNEEGAAAQERINSIDEATSKIVTEYRSVLDQLETVRAYNRQLEILITSQEEEIQAINDDIDNVTTIQRVIPPLMNDMVDGLENFVSLDVPFLAEERAARVAGLKELMGRADASTAEKFRRVLESYQIENEYGRTMEAYQGTLEDGRTVEFLRVGRVIFIYQTLDGTESAVWNQASGGWEPLGDEYRLAIRNALRIARQQVAPDLLILPVPAPQAASAS